jgi:hypothetical protein
VTTGAGRYGTAADASPTRAVLSEFTNCRTRGALSRGGKRFQLSQSAA